MELGVAKAGKSIIYITVSAILLVFRLLFIFLVHFVQYGRTPQTALQLIVLKQE